MSILNNYKWVLLIIIVLSVYAVPRILIVPGMLIKVENQSSVFNNNITLTTYNGIHYKYCDRSYLFPHLLCAERRSNHELDNTSCFRIMPVILFSLIGTQKEQDYLLEWVDASASWSDTGPRKLNAMGRYNFKPKNNLQIFVSERKIELLISENFIENYFRTSGKKMIDGWNEDEIRFNWLFKQHFGKNKKQTSCEFEDELIFQVRHYYSKSEQTNDSLFKETKTKYKKLNWSAIIAYQKNSKNITETIRWNELQILCHEIPLDSVNNVCTIVLTE